MICLNQIYICWLNIDFYFAVFHSPRLDAKLDNGLLLNQGSMKYMALLRINMIHFCNGCLITENFVLTAGQCIARIVILSGENFTLATVLLGTSSLSKPGVSHDIQNVAYPDEGRLESLSSMQTSDIGLILVHTLIIIIPLPTLENPHSYEVACVFQRPHQVIDLTIFYDNRHLIRQRIIAVTLIS